MKTERLTVSDIEQWIDNDEGLYNWWRSERGSKREFIKRNRSELETCINRLYVRIRLRSLAKKEALGELTPEEAVELESLTQLRRQEHHPRSADEIIWHRRQQKLTRTLLEALKDYVEFHEGPRGS